MTTSAVIPRSRAVAARARALRWLAATVALLLALSVSPADALAQQRPPPNRPAAAEPVAQKVTIDLMVVHATNAHPQADARLKPIMQHLRFLNYTGFDLLETHTQALVIDQEATFEIVGDRQVTIQLLERNEESARLRVRMFNKNGKLLDTTVSIHRNRSFMVAGPKHEDGVLILPVTARY